MAQLDTGLGWSAKDEWIKSSPQLVGTISDISGYILPQCDANKAAVMANGVVFMRRSASHAYSYVASNYHNVAFAAYPKEAGSYYFVFMSYDSNAVGYFAGGFFTNLASYTLSNYDSSRNIYYVALNYIASEVTSNIPYYTTLEECLDSFSIVRQNLYKLNQGASVTSIATWITLEGNTLISPVLISSNPLFTIHFYLFLKKPLHNHAYLLRFLFLLAPLFLFLYL